MISYDTNVLIYALEGHGEYGEVSKRIVLEGELKGAVLSVLAKQELLTGVLVSGTSMQDTKMAFESLASLQLCDVTEEVVDVALGLTAKYGKKCMGYDALIVATAITAGADVYYTNDKDLLSLSIDEIAIKGLVA